MSDKAIPSQIEMEETVIDQKLHREKTNDTVSTGWEETDVDEEYSFTFSNGIASS